MSTRDLFLCCAPMCACACVCIRLSVCLYMCACMSMSSLLTNPSHPSDTVTLSTLCFLSLSDWLPPWREPRTHQIMLLFHRETVWFIHFRSEPKASASTAPIFTCTCGQMCTYRCRNEHKTSRYDRFFHGVSLLCHICLWNRQVQGYGHIFSCRLRTVAWHTSMHGRLFVNVPQE